MRMGNYELVEPRVGEFEVRREVERRGGRRRLLVLKRTANISEAVDFIHHVQDAEHRALDELREACDDGRRRFNHVA